MVSKHAFIKLSTCFCDQNFQMSRTCQPTLPRRALRLSWPLDYMRYCPVWPQFVLHAIANFGQAGLDQSSNPRRHAQLLLRRTARVADTFTAHDLDQYGYLTNVTSKDRQSRRLGNRVWQHTNRSVNDQSNGRMGKDSNRKIEHTKCPRKLIATSRKSWFHSSNKKFAERYRQLAQKSSTKSFPKSPWKFKQGPQRYHKGPKMFH